jgi:hypothetical protein
LRRQRVAAAGYLASARLPPEREIKPNFDTCRALTMLRAASAPVQKRFPV